MRLGALAFVLTASAAVAGEPVFVLASLERTACYGTCPAYRLTVFSDGRLEYDGREYVKVRGRKTAQLTPAELEALRKAFTDANYLNLGDGYDCDEVTDQPHYKTSFSDGRRVKAIDHYRGCRSKRGIEALTALENKFDELVGSVRWVGTRDERRQLKE